MSLGLNLPADDLQQLLAVDTAGWKKEAEDVAANYAKFDGKLPNALSEQFEKLRKRLG